MAGDLAQLHEHIAAGDSSALRAELAHLVPRDNDEALRLLAIGAGGAPAVLEVLLERLHDSGMVHRMVRALILEESAVDDIGQEVLISVASGIAGFRGDAKFTTWLQTIVRHRVVDHLRRQRATSPLPEDDVRLATRMSSMLAARATVQAVLAELPELYRGPVTLRDIDGLPYRDIAERLGRSEGTIKAQIARGRALVAGRLREPLDIPARERA